MSDYRKSAENCNISCLPNLSAVYSNVIVLFGMILLAISWYLAKIISSEVDIYLIAVAQFLFISVSSMSVLLWRNINPIGQCISSIFEQQFTQFNN